MMLRLGPDDIDVGHGPRDYEPQQLIREYRQARAMRSRARTPDPRQSQRPNAVALRLRYRDRLDDWATA